MKLNEQQFNEAIEYLEESLFTKNDLEINLDKWTNGSILFVTGVSGSGKSTISAEYSEKENAYLFQLDTFFKFPRKTREEMLTTELDRFIHKKKWIPNDPIFIKVFKEFVKRLDDESFNTFKPNQQFPSEKEVKKIFENALNFIEYCEGKLDKNRKYIFEGSHIYAGDPEYFVDKPLIVKGTGYVKSSFRALKRDYEPGENIKNFKRFVYRIVRMFDRTNPLYKQSKQLDNFRKDVLKEAIEYLEEFID